MTHDDSSTPSPKDDQQLALFDEGALDISIYLLDEADEPVPLPQRQGFSALMIGEVYGDIGASPIYAFREAMFPVVQLVRRAGPKSRDCCHR